MGITVHHRPVNAALSWSCTSGKTPGTAITSGTPKAHPTEASSTSNSPTPPIRASCNCFFTPPTLPPGRPRGSRTTSRAASSSPRPPKSGRSREFAACHLSGPRAYGSRVFRRGRAHLPGHYPQRLQRRPSLLLESLRPDRAHCILPETARDDVHNISTFTVALLPWMTAGFHLKLMQPSTNAWEPDTASGVPVTARRCG